MKNKHCGPQAIKLETEQSIIIWNPQEGQPDNPAMDTHFMINLNTQQIHDKFQDM
jgi:hypothetical protein